MTVKLRLAATGWFCRWFYNRRGPALEPEYQPEPDETLYCTPNGSLRYSQQGDTIFSRMLKTQASLPPSRQLPSTHSELEAYRAALGAEIAQLLKVRRNSDPLGARHIVTTPRKGYHVEKMEFNFPLLSDPDRGIAQAYHAVKDDGQGIWRSVYVVGRDGKIRYAQRGAPPPDDVVTTFKENTRGG